MSKIESYKDAQRTANIVKENLDKARGLDRYNNDKHQLSVRFTGVIDHNNWNEATLFLRASYGYYGSSSGYTAMDKNTAEYMARAINHYMNQIAEHAITLAKNDAELARIAAKEEAEAILKDV